MEAKTPRKTSKPEHHQVIIIGAGPGGTTCAKRLAEKGIDVLIIERRDVIGNPAQCGECIPNWGEVIGTFRGIDDHEWLKKSFDFPEYLKNHHLDNMRVFLPSGKHYSFKLDAFGGHRLQFDGYLADLAVEAGAKIKTGEALTKIQQKKDGTEVLHTSLRNKYTFDYLIDGSGALGHVARLRGRDEKTHRPSDQVPTAYAQVTGNIPETFDVFLGSVAPMGYAWIIPKGPNLANVGLGSRGGKLGDNVKEKLIEFCAQFDFEILSIGGGWIPMGGMVKHMVDGNSIAIGDAAGLVMPSNGGGISQAMISGCFAAESIIENLDNGSPLTSYRKKIDSCMKAPLRNSLRSKEMGYAFMRGNLLTEIILRILGPIGGIKRAMECHRPLWLL